MKRKSLWKVLGTGMLAFSLIVSPLAATAAQAAEMPEGQTTEPTETEEETLDGQQENRAGEGGDTNVTPAAEGDGTGDGAAGGTDDGTTEDPMVKEGGEKTDLDPLRDEEIPAEGTEGEPDYKPAKEAYADVEIPVWGFTEDATVYSVDVEWGAMTFQWENSSWDPETHMKKAGAGWKVYDSAANRALNETVHEINEIKVTNHSNAKVYASLWYTAVNDGIGDFSDTRGCFSAATDYDENRTFFQENYMTSPAYLRLDTADNSEVEGEAGTPTVAKAYFMPYDLKEELKKDDGITKWTKIGTITVGIKTEVPTWPEP